MLDKTLVPSAESLTSFPQTGREAADSVQPGARSFAGGRDGARGTVLALVLAANRLGFRLSLGFRHFGSLKDSRSQLPKVLASLRSFVVFVFHLHSLSSLGKLMQGHASQPVQSLDRSATSAVARD